MADPAICVRVLWLDETMVEVRVRACAPEFSAEVSFYESHGFAREFSAALRGFPEHPLDTRRHALGNWHTATSGAGVEFRFSSDSAGHTQIVAQFETDQVLPKKFRRSSGSCSTRKLRASTASALNSRRCPWKSERAQSWSLPRRRLL